MWHYGRHLHNGRHSTAVALPHTTKAGLATQIPQFDSNIALRHFTHIETDLYRDQQKESRQQLQKTLKLLTDQTTFWFGWCTQDQRIIRIVKRTKSPYSVLLLQQSWKVNNQTLLVLCILRCSNIQIRDWSTYGGNHIFAITTSLQKDSDINK